MKGFVLTHQGMEDIAADEVTELIKQDSKEYEGCITFTIKKPDDLFKLCYKSQSVGKVCSLITEFSYKDLENDLEKNLEKVNWSEYFAYEESIQVRCKKTDDTELHTPEIEKGFSSVIIRNIHKKTNHKQPVNLKNPKIPILVYITKSKCFIGIDYAGFDLSKRPHHIFTHPADIKGTVGFALIKLAELDENKLMIDPFAGSGTITIEAALYNTVFPVQYYSKEKFSFLHFSIYNDFNFNKFFENEDKKFINEKVDVYNCDASMKYITFAKKNAQIAGILKNMEFRRMPLEWFDTKYEKGEVDLIVTKMPYSRLEKDPEKNYKEFFYQSEFVLKKTGRIVIIGKHDLIEKYAKQYKFKIIDSRQIHSGKETYNIFILSKS